LAKINNKNRFFCKKYFWMLNVIVNIFSYQLFSLRSLRPRRLKFLAKNKDLTANRLAR